MNLEDVKNFINQVHWGTLATSDGRKVGVGSNNKSHFTHHWWKLNNQLNIK